MQRESKYIVQGNILKKNVRYLIVKVSRKKEIEYLHSEYEQFECHNEMLFGILILLIIIQVVN